MYLCVRGIDFVSFYDFCIRFWDCYDSVVFLVYHFIYSTPAGEIYHAVADETTAHISKMVSKQRSNKKRTRLKVCLLW